MKPPVKEKCILILSVDIEVGASMLINVGSEMPVLFAVHAAMGTHSRATLRVPDTAVGSVTGLNMLLQSKESTKRFGTVMTYFRLDVERDLVDVGVSLVLKMQSHL